MTDSLRDLLRESVADVAAPDLADVAWRSGVRTRRRRAVSAVTGVAGVAVVVGGLAWVVDQRGGPDGAAPIHRPSASASHTSVPSDQHSPRLGGAEPDAVVPGVGRIWWGPTSQQEAELPQWTSVVPPTIDLRADAPDILDNPIARAMAAFAVFDDSGLERVVVMTQGGALRAVDVSRLDKVTKANGYRLWPETQSMLSPTGRYLMFPQDGHLETFRLSTGQWGSVETGSTPTADATWFNDTDVLLPRHGVETPGPTYDVTTGRRDGAAADASLIDPGDSGRAYPYGREREGPGGGARSYDVPAGLVPVRPGSLDMGMVLAVRGFDGPRDHDAVSFTASVSTGRWKQCCSVVGWLDDGPVVYESKGATPRLVAWRVGTHEFGQLATITGVTAGQQSFVSSWARLWGRWPAR